VTWRCQFVRLLLSACFVSVAAGYSRAGADSRPASVCATCHYEAKSQPATSMGHALETVEECATLAAHPLLTFKDTKYSYRIERRGGQSLYAVSDGDRTLTIPIGWAMGASSAIGQTYVLEKDGQLYESRVSYFSELQGLGITMGAEGFAPTNLLEAAGRLMGRDDELNCFGCHATNATQGREFTPAVMTAGVQCERCHGPAEKHLEWATKGGSPPVIPKKLSRLSTDQVSDFCGQCHRTWADVAATGRFDVTDVRFQPYRLATSECYDGDDARISCLACHDPHREVNANATAYDSKCMACHGGGKAGAKKCSVAATGCTTCHMPKIELPGGHHKFSDHRIRIVRANEPFPG
jgi:Cytochrome c554 and c-prime